MLNCPTGNVRSSLNLSVASTTAFRRMPPVHGTDREGPLRVELTRSPHRLAMTYLRKAAVPLRARNGPPRFAALEIGANGSRRVAISDDCRRSYRVARN
jgi:hypothetical protein